MRATHGPFIGAKAGLKQFEALEAEETERAANRRWQHTWFVWAMCTTVSTVIFLTMAIVFGVLYAQQYPQCSLKDMHFTSSVTHSTSNFPILQTGSAFYHNPSYGHKLTDCEKWLLRGLEKMPAHTTAPVHGVQSNS